MLKNWRAKEEDVDAIAAARQKDPFAVLRPHLTAEGWTIRAFVTDALSVRAITREGAPIVELGRRKSDFFEGLILGATERPVEGGWAAFGLGRFSHASRHPKTIMGISGQ